MNRPQASWKIISILAVTQIVSWGTLFYAFSILAPEIQRELGWTSELVYGALSWGLLVAGVSATPAGIMLDRIGGRLVMTAGSLASALGLLVLGLSQSLPAYFAAWTVLGVGMALVLYEAAFATINREIAGNPRRAISTVTLVGGLASTAFWPITLALVGKLGWRDTCLAFGALQLLVCAPLHFMLAPTKRAPALQPTHEHSSAPSHNLREALSDQRFWKLVLAISANAFVFSALAVHLIPTLVRMGHAITLAVLVAAAIGPMQVLGRLIEMAFAPKTNPVNVGRLTFAMLPIALAILLVAGRHPWATAFFCALYGVSNGLLTIVKGTIPRTIFGQKHYGAIAGAIAAPALLALAAGPLVTAAAIRSHPSPDFLLAILLGTSVFSVVCYFLAVRSAAGKG